ncbi:putative dehydrogenase [Tamaricihabitans halophyticus]|uniref:Putative dehydrogenase n=1 Tax=Tamaricihabitans halophyticus TaxID=1262583 RepID=A0A4R2R2T1_9PSEU|nr:Gfo/Idh/MocA family oxidoreductase [Tamaricihabitans halophyticus]TCP56114.1 putative dehydrogenase [Tamaricihabitans halophyticus]
MQGTTIGVAVIGHAFMGAVHSHAWRNVHRFFGLAWQPRQVVLAGRDRARTQAAADKMGWPEVTTDWTSLLERSDVDVIDICTPGDSHADMAIAALAAGKHVICEKPLANTLAEAERMASAAAEAAERGVRAMVAFNYRRVPALAFARRLVADGRLGELRHVRATYLQDWLANPDAPMSWRLRKEHAGSGALGDIGAHIVDATQFVTGEPIEGVSALTDTFVRRRPGTATGNGRLEDVTVDDCALFHGRLRSGAVASFEATRYALGRKNSMRLELNGSRGSLAFDFESMNELHFHDGTNPDPEAGFRRILVTEPEHPYLEAWWPPGHPLGYEHTFTHEIADFLTALADGSQPRPDFADGLRVQRVLDAVQRSAANSSQWTAVDAAPTTVGSR